MNTDTTDATLEVDFGQTLEAMIAAGKYDWVDPDITAKKFAGAGRKKFRTRLFRFDRHISSEDAVAAMQKEGFAPATHVHGLAFGVAFPEEQHGDPIACLGSSAQVRGGRGVLCLGGGGVQRALSVYLWAVEWLLGWRFLGVQEVSGASC